MLNKSIDDEIKPVLDSVNCLQNDLDTLRSGYNNAIDMWDGWSTKHLMNRDSDEDIESNLEPGGQLSVDNIQKI